MHQIPTKVKLSSAARIATVMARAACAAVAIGAAGVPAALRSGGTGLPAFATTTSASASLLSGFNDWEIHSLEQKKGGAAKKAELLKLSCRMGAVKWNETESRPSAKERKDAQRNNAVVRRLI